MPDTVAARTLPPMLRATVAPDSLLPVMVLPTSAALMMSSVATVLMTGEAAGAVVSPVTVKLLVAVLTLPATSVSLALNA